MAAVAIEEPTGPLLATLPAMCHQQAGKLVTQSDVDRAEGGRSGALATLLLGTPATSLSSYV